MVTTMANCTFPYCKREANNGTYCYDHYRLMGNEKIKEEKPKAIKKVSDKRKAEDKEYARLKKQYLKSMPVCELDFKGCTKIATEIHHTKGGKDRAKTYLDTDTWKATCNNCHRHGHDKLSAREAKEYGFKN